MKKIFLFIIFLVSMSMAYAGPAMPYQVFGFVTINGADANGMTVEFYNVNSQKTMSMLSVGNGAFGFDISKDGYSDGDKFTIKYCIEDTRCDERTTSQYTVGSTGHAYGYNLGSFDSNNKGDGGSAPYILYGTLYDSGVKVTSGSLVIKNTITGSKETITIDQDGYQYNLANFGYNTGDTISVTYGSHVKEFIVVGNSGMELNFDIAPTTPGTPSSSNNDGSNSNRDSTTIPTVNSGNDILLETNPFSIEGTENSKVYLNIKGTRHTLTFNKINLNSAEVWIESDLIKVIINVGESKRVDIDKDGSFDFYVYLEKIVQGKAFITLLTPNMEDLTDEEKDVIVDAEDAIHVTPDEPVVEEVIAEEEKLSTGYRILISVLIIGAIIGIIIFFNNWSNYRHNNLL